MTKAEAIAKIKESMKESNVLNVTEAEQTITNIEGKKVDDVKAAEYMHTGKPQNAKEVTINKINNVQITDDVLDAIASNADIPAVADAINMYENGLLSGVVFLNKVLKALEDDNHESRRTNLDY